MDEHGAGGRKDESNVSQRTLCMNTVHFDHPIILPLPLHLSMLDWQCR